MDRSLEEMLDHLEQRSTEGQIGTPPSMMLELIAAIRSRLSPVQGEELPELKFTEQEVLDATAKTDDTSAMNISALRDYVYQILCVVYCRERQLREYGAEIRRLKGERDADGRLISGLRQENESQRAQLRFEASWQRDGFWRWQGDETDELESLTCGIAISAADMREILKRIETAELALSASRADALRASEIGMTREEMRQGLEAAAEDGKREARADALKEALEAVKGERLVESADRWPDHNAALDYAEKAILARMEKAS